MSSSRENDINNNFADDSHTESHANIENQANQSVDQANPHKKAFKPRDNSNAVYNTAKLKRKSDDPINLTEQPPKKPKGRKPPKDNEGDPDYKPPTQKKRASGDNIIDSDIYLSQLNDSAAMKEAIFTNGIAKAKERTKYLDEANGSKPRAAKRYKKLANKVVCNFYLNNSAVVAAYYTPTDNVFHLVEGTNPRFKKALPIEAIISETNKKDISIVRYKQEIATFEPKTFTFKQSNRLANIKHLQSKAEDTLEIVFDGKVFASLNKPTNNNNNSSSNHSIYTINTEASKELDARDIENKIGQSFHARLFKVVNPETVISKRSAGTQISERSRSDESKISFKVNDVTVALYDIGSGSLKVMDIDSYKIIPKGITNNSSTIVFLDENNEEYATYTKVSGDCTLSHMFVEPELISKLKDIFTNNIKFPSYPPPSSPDHSSAGVEVDRPVMPSSTSDLPQRESSTTTTTQTSVSTTSVPTSTNSQNNNTDQERLSELLHQSELNQREIIEVAEKLKQLQAKQYELNLEITRLQNSQEPPKSPSMS